MNHAAHRRANGSQNYLPRPGRAARTDTLIPFPWDNRLNLYADPDRMLRFAVLVDAVLLLQRERGIKDAKRKRHVQEAKRWIWREDTAWPFSFRNICDALGLDADYLRRGLRQWQSQGHPGGLTGRPRPAAARRPYHCAR